LADASLQARLGDHVDPQAEEVLQVDERLAMATTSLVPSVA
jgi:hypothetical protein